MVFHANKWGWKRLAARLLLIPVIGGTGTGLASAQATGSPTAAGTPAKTARPATGDARALLKEGRRALAAGQFERAQDLARAAEASNPTGKWGLFEDTPNALLKDIQAAVVKANKAQSEQMLKEAKALLARPTSSEAERAANLDRALQLAQRAEQLHGPYSLWDFGDRPDRLIKEIQAARSRLRVPPMNPAATAPTAAKTPAPTSRPAAGNGYSSAFASPTTPAPTSRPTLTPSGGPQPAAGPASTAAADPRKTQAQQLMAEARRLADAGQFAAARAKLLEADRLNAPFAAHEPNPSFALQELNARGSAALDRLLTEAKARLAEQDYAKADAALTGAAEIASALGLFAGPVKDLRAQLHAASGGKYGAVAVAAAGGPETPMPVGPAAPAGPVPPSSSSGPASQATAGTLTGKQLLDQAVAEFQRGELDMAAKLALQAHNLGGVKDEAAALLNSIDAKRLEIKKATAARSFEAAETAFKAKDYDRALGLLVLIDPNLLGAEQKTRHGELVAACRTALDRAGAETAVKPASGTQDLPKLPVSPGETASSPPPAATPTPAPPPGGDAADNLVAQQEALKRAQFQKLRAEGLKVQSDAQAAFGRGETDLAIQMLLDYANRVRAAGLDASHVALLLRPIDSRLEMFRVMKGQIDATLRVNREAREARAAVAERGLAEEQRRTEIQRLVRSYHALVQKGDYAEAERVALQAKQLDPDDPALSALAHMAKVNKRVREQEQLKDEKERMVYGALTDAEKPGPLLTVEDPLAVRLEAYSRAKRRGSLDHSYNRTRTPAEYEIELKLDKPIPIDVTQTPLELVIDNLRTVTNLPISIDTAAIEAEGINLSKPITEKLPPVATRHVLSIVLEKAGLSYVVENDVVKVTTAKKAKGRLFTKVFSVADLVTPVPNFALPDYANFELMLKANAVNQGRAHIQGLNAGGGNTPFVPAQGLGGGTPASSYPAAAVPPGSLQPGIAGGLNFGPTGQLQTNVPNPLGGSATLAGERNTKHEQLIKLITRMIRPYTWDEMGGPGRIEYYDLGSALIVNQTADVVQEVADLLEALRRLQDLAIAVEVRIVSLSETFYERLGVDFSMNIKTNNRSFEPALTQVDPNTGLTGVFRPAPYLNDNNFKGVTVGLTPAGTFTPDLDVPIRPNTFNRAIPPFGGYPNTPGDNGGVAFGLAFLNDIQVYMFLEAAQGDRRVNVMQAPKLTLFNGQTATLSVNNLQFFVTNVTVVSVNGQLVFIPQNTPLPGPGGFANGGQLDIAIQAVVSADRRFVRLNLPVTMAAQTGATVPLFPITTFITPVFEGGSQGIPIPFTQFLQQPAFTTLTIQTTVVCPDGGTVLLGGLKTLQEGRNEFGPPFLSKIPYLNRLFKNVGIGRETTHIMLMVTPRIIINSEEEIFQTEGRQAVPQP